MDGGFLDEARKRFSSGCINRAEIQDMQLQFLLCSSNFSHFYRSQTVLLKEWRAKKGTRGPSYAPSKLPSHCWLCLGSLQARHSDKALPGWIHPQLCSRKDGRFCIWLCKNTALMCCSTSFILIQQFKLKKYMEEIMNLFKICRGATWPWRHPGGWSGKRWQEHLLQFFSLRNLSQQLSLTRFVKQLD